MPIVNYVREHTRFIEYATDEHLTSAERLVWYALMHIMNQRAQGNVWPEDFVRVSNERLLSYCPMKFDTMAQARNSLKQRGLIEVLAGEKNKKSPAYRMVYFYPEKSDNMGDNTGGNTGDNTGGNPGDNMGDFNINDTDKRRTLLNPKRLSPEEEHEGYENRQRVGAYLTREDFGRMMSEADAQLYALLHQMWLRNFGKEATPAMLENLLSWQAGIEPMDAAVIQRAIEIAGGKGVGDPMAYVGKLLYDWKTHGVRNEDQLDDYLDNR